MHSFQTNIHNPTSTVWTVLLYICCPAVFLFHLRKSIFFIFLYKISASLISLCLTVKSNLFSTFWSSLLSECSLMSVLIVGGLSQHLPAGPGGHGRPASLPFSLKGVSFVLLWWRALSDLLHRVTHTAQTGGSVAIDLFVRPSGPLPAWVLEWLPALTWCLRVLSQQIPELCA